MSRLAVLGSTARGCRLTRAISSRTGASGLSLAALDRALSFVRLLVCTMLVACEATDEESVRKALEHSAQLVEILEHDVGEIRRGLPLGAKELEGVWNDGDLVSEPASARSALEKARSAVQDLRIAKSTFFAITGPSGVVVRNDREQDLMAGQPLFQAFPGLKVALEGGQAEAFGDMPEARGVRGKPDAQWMVARSIQVDGEARALYVTGWSWASYCYRLEFALRGRIEDSLKGSRENVPLVYAFVLVGDDVYGSPESPEVNARSIAELDVGSALKQSGQVSRLLEITGRTFAFAARSVPDLAPNVAVGVLRSET